MESSRISKGLTVVLACAALGIAGATAAGEMRGTVVWVDLKNSALLIVCDEDAACKDVSGKKGETFTLIIPEGMKQSATSWKEGGKVAVVFEDRDSGGRALKTVSAMP